MSNEKGLMLVVEVSVVSGRSSQYKECVQGTGDSDSTCLYSAIAKPNMTIKTKKLSKAEIPSLLPINLNRKFLNTLMLIQDHLTISNAITSLDFVMSLHP